MALHMLANALTEIGCSVYFQGARHGGNHNRVTNPFNILARKPAELSIDNAIAIYPEITTGNDFHARRWLTWMMYFPRAWGQGRAGDQFGEKDVVACFGSGVCTGGPGTGAPAGTKPVAARIQFGMMIFDWQFETLAELEAELAADNITPKDAIGGLAYIGKAGDYWGKGKPDKFYSFHDIGSIEERNKMTSPIVKERMAPRDLCRKCVRNETRVFYSYFTAMSRRPSIQHASCYVWVFVRDYVAPAHLEECHLHGISQHSHYKVRDCIWEGARVCCLAV